MSLCMYVLCMYVCMYACALYVRASVHTYLCTLVCIEIDKKEIQIQI